MKKSHTWFGKLRVTSGIKNCVYLVGFQQPASHISVLRKLKSRWTSWDKIVRP